MLVDKYFISKWLLHGLEIYLSTYLRTEPKPNPNYALRLTKTRITEVAMSVKVYPDKNVLNLYKCDQGYQVRALKRKVFFFYLFDKKYKELFRYSLGCEALAPESTKVETLAQLPLWPGCDHYCDNLHLLEQHFAWRPFINLQKKESFLSTLF